MGDLAPFVAAAIRDKVVQEQHEQIDSLEAKLETSKNENLELRQRLLFQNPVKRLSLRDGLDNGKLYAEAEMNILTFNATEPSPMSICEDAFCTIEELLTMEIQIDGRRVARLADLECQSENYIYCDQSLEYFLCITFSCPGLSMHAYLSPFLPDKHKQLTGRLEQPISPVSMLDTHTRFHCPINPQRLLEFSDTAQVKIPFMEGDFSCTPEFFERSVQNIFTF